MMKFLCLLEDVFFPAKCLNCHGKVQKQELFCASCRRQLQDIRFLYPTGYGCRHLDGICLLYSYERGVKTALHKIKFEKKRQLLPRAAEEIKKVCYCADLGAIWELSENMLLIPVPTDTARFKARGYDVPTDIFKPWGEREELIWCEALERVLQTVPQYGLNKNRRRKNVKNCFVVRENVFGKDIFLVDDIFTSGATMEEAAKTLKKAGAAKIWALAFAGGAQV